MIDLNETIISDIREFCRQQNIAESTFGQRAVHDWRLIERLEAGKTITLRTAERIRQYIAENTPSKTSRRTRKVRAAA